MTTAASSSRSRESGRLRVVRSSASHRSAGAARPRVARLGRGPARDGSRARRGARAPARPPAPRRPQRGHRRRHLYPEIGGAELDDLCRQAADDAVVAVTAQARRLPRRQPLHDLGLRVRRLRDLGEAPPARLARRHASRPPTTTPRGTGWPRAASAAQARVESAELLRRPAPRGRRGAVAAAARGLRRGRAERRRDRRRRRAACSRPAARSTRCSTTHGGSSACASSAKVTWSRWRRDERTRSADAAARHSGEDAGCEGGLALLAEYVEGELAGRDVVELFPGRRRAPAQLPRVRGGLRGPARARPRAAATLPDGSRY